MTSGHFTSFPLDQIVLDREHRQRKTIDDIEDLAKSIMKLGLIHPIVIERNGNLRVGERRFTACKMLGWTHMPVQFVDELSEAELQLLELEENVRRKQLPWQDECLAVEHYHQLRSEEDGWNAEKTAEALGMSISNVKARRLVAAELSKGNERVSDAPKYSIAYGIASRERERKINSSLAKVEEVISEKPKTEAPVLNVSFHDWQPSYTGPKFNFIHCDFPYGIGSHGHDQGGAKSFGGFEDTPEVYWQLIDRLKESMTNVVAESAHLMFWFSMDYYADTLAALQGMGWTVDNFPLIWWKSDNSGILSDPQRGPRRVYETCFFASRGDRKIVRAVSNLHGYPNIRSVHMNQKNPGMLGRFFEMFVDQYSIVLDPTCGSGSALRVAREKGAKHVLGLEINPEFYNLAKESFDGPESDL